VVWITPVRWLGWLDWFGWAQLVVVFWVVLNGVRTAGPRRFLFIALVGLAFVSVLLACHQRFVNPKWLMLGRTQAEQFFGRASGPFGSPNSLAALLLLILPALGALTLRRGATVVERVFWGWLGLVIGFGFVLTISRGGWLALALAVGLWPLTAGHLPWTRRLRRSAGILAAAILVGGGLVFAAPKVRERFLDLGRHSGETTRPILWRAGWELFHSQPLAGTGAGSYNLLFERHRPERFPDEPQWTHNDYLNTLSDYGAAGFGLFFGACGVIAVGCARASQGRPIARFVPWFETPALGRGMTIGLSAFAIQLLVDFHFKIPALAMSFATMAALAVGRTWPGPVEPVVRHPAIKLGLAVGGVGLAVALLGGILPAIRGEAQRYRARQHIDHIALFAPDAATFRTLLSTARAGLERGVQLSPGNGQAWADLAYVRSLWAHVEPEHTAALGRDAEIAAERALALTQVSPEFWIRRGVARDLQGRWLEAGEDFVTATSMAPHNAIAWYYYAEHLSRKATERDLAEAVLAFCLRLDPGNRAGLALRQRLAISRSAQ